MIIKTVKRDGANRCAGKESFKHPALLTELAVCGVMLLLSMAIAFFWVRWQKREPGMRKLLPWYTFIIALCLSALVYILTIPILPLDICLDLWDSRLHHGLSTASAIAADLANVLLLAIILIPLTKRVLDITGRSSHTIRLSTIGALTLTMMIFIPYAALKYMAAFWAFGYVELSTTLLWANVAVQVTYRVVIFSASLFSAVLVSFAAAKPALGVNHAALPVSLKFYAAMTPIIFAVSNLPPVIYWPLYGLTDKDVATVPYIVAAIVMNLCLTLSFISLLLTARITSSSALPSSLEPDSAPSSLRHSTSDPKRFSYAEQHSNRSRYSFHSAITSPGSDPVPDLPDMPPIDLNHAAPPTFRPERRKSVHVAEGTVPSAGVTMPLFDITGYNYRK